MAQQVKNRHSVPEDVGSISGLTQWVKDPVLHELWYRSQIWFRSCIAVAMV